MDNDGTCHGVRIERVNFRENIRPFFSWGLTKLFAVYGCPYQAGVRRARFNCTQDSEEIGTKKDSYRLTDINFVIQIQYSYKNDENGEEKGVMVRFKALARCLKLNCCCFDIDAELSCSLIKREPYESSSLTFKTTALMTNYILLHSITLNVIYIYIYIFFLFCPLYYWDSVHFPFPGFLYELSCCTCKHWHLSSDKPHLKNSNFVTFHSKTFNKESHEYVFWERSSSKWSKWKNFSCAAFSAI